MPAAKPPELKQAALADLAAGQSLGEVAERYGLQKPILSKWAKATGVAIISTERTRLRVEAAQCHWAERRADMVDQLGEVAEETLKAIRGALQTKPRVAADLARVLAVTIDKAQLLGGHATSRTEHVESIDVELRRLAEEVKARA